MSAAHWMFTANETLGRLLRVERTDTGDLHVTVEDDIRNLDREQRSDRHASPPARSSHADSRSERGNNHIADQFAREIAVWLEQHASELRIQRLSVFAPPRFLGALHGAWSSRFALCVDEHADDLSDLPPDDLAHHQSIECAMSSF